MPGRSHSTLAEEDRNEGFSLRGRASAGHVSQAHRGAPPPCGMNRVAGRVRVSFPSALAQSDVSHISGPAHRQHPRGGDVRACVSLPSGSVESGRVASAGPKAVHGRPGRRGVRQASASKANVSRLPKAGRDPHQPRKPVAGSAPNEPATPAPMERGWRVLVPSFFQRSWKPPCHTARRHGATRRCIHTIL